MTHWATVVALAAGVGLFPGFAQEAQDYTVYTEPPRLLLNARRLKLLKREKERQSIRWMQFESLMAGKARMAEPGFSGALYGVVADQAESCKAAGQWAATQAKLESPGDLRQAALVFDWCGAKLGETQASQLARKLNTAATGRGGSIAAIRSRLLAAIAVADSEPKTSQTVARQVAEQWWSQEMVPLLKKESQAVTGREDLYALMEILHVMRDNFRLELKDDAGRYFDELPPIQLLSYYPQPWPAAENEYRIPMYSGKGDPVLEEAAFSRAAELALVAYDGNPQPVQFLQGWLMQDRFLLRGTFGIPYEFLWANPYLPGLSYQYMPDLFHSRGMLLVRATWDDDSAWLAAIGGQCQYFNDGKRVVVNPKAMVAPVNVGDVTVHFWKGDMRFEAGNLPMPNPEEQKVTAEEVVFVVGAKPGTAYNVEVDGEEMYEARADVGGIVALKFLRGRAAGVRMAEAIVGSVALRADK